jgi:hypothetical protein
VELIEVAPIRVAFRLLDVSQQVGTLLQLLGAVLGLPAPVWVICHFHFPAPETLEAREIAA